MSIRSPISLVWPALLSVLVLLLCAGHAPLAFAAPPGTQLYTFFDEALFPGGLDLDSSGFIYVTNELEASVDVLSPLTSTTPGALVAQYYDETLFLCYPTDVKVDAAGNMYVCDQCYGTRIAILASRTSTTAPPGTELFSLTANSTLNGPSSVALDASENIYVADSNNNRVVVMAGISSVNPPPGTVLFSFDNAPDYFNYVGSVLVDSAGRIYVSDCGNARIVVLDGIHSAQPGLELLSFNDTQSPLSFGLYDMALDGNNNLFLTDDYNGRVVVLAGYNASHPPGTELFSYNSSAISGPQGVALDADNNVYISNLYNYAVLVAAGIHSVNPAPGTQLGQFIPSGTSEPFIAPMGIALDAAGNMAVNDNGNDRVVVLASLTSNSVPAGGLLHSYTDSSQPLARGRNIALDAAGNFYVICVQRGVVVLASSSSTSVTPGSEIANFNHSYIPFVFPTGIAVDQKTGSIYVADSNVAVWVLAGIDSVSPPPGTILASFNNTASGCIALDDDGNMYVGHNGDFTPGGSDPPRVIVLASLSSTTATPGSVLYSFVDSTNPLSSPFGIAIDSFGRIYVSDTYAYRVAVLNGIKSSTPGTEIVSLYDNDQGFNFIVGVAVDAAGNVYVVDEGNDRVAVLAGLGPLVSALGDPQLHGFLGQSYQVHGMDGAVYSVISAPALQLNARFIFLSAGVCPVYSSGAVPSNCWSHPGSYFGAIGIRTASGARLLIVPGSARVGFESVQLDGVELLSGDEQAGGRKLLPFALQSASGDLGVAVVDSHHVTVSCGIFTLSIDSSDRFVNLAAVSVSSWSDLVRKVQPHGLLGQSWRRGAEAVPGSDVREVEGRVDDYVQADNDIFGYDNIYSRFAPTPTAA